jgi:N-acetylglucosaminyldiphosphoundecaprenol N-acetyl-beta-D-mannosaminyltransferase
MAQKPFPAIFSTIFGINLTPITLKDLIHVVTGAETRQPPVVISGHNLHSVYLFHTDAKVRSFYESSQIILADGFPIWISSYSFKARSFSTVRLGSTDWLPKVFDAAPSGFRIAVVGATQTSNRDFVNKHSTGWPNLVIKGWQGHNIDAVDLIDVAQEIQDFEPNLTLVGLGMPNQEIFVNDLLSMLPAGVIATVGGAIDQLSGYQRNAPRFLGKLGIEWLFRLVTQPRRLWRRYLVEPLILVSVLSKYHFKTKDQISRTFGQR